MERFDFEISVMNKQGMTLPQFIQGRIPFGWTFVVDLIGLIYICIYICC